MSAHRRAFLLGLAAALTAPLASLAQGQRPKVFRIGLLESGARFPERLKALVTGLDELGYVEGKNYVIDHRWVDGNFERLPALAQEMIRTRVDVIIASSRPAIRAAQQATTSVPIVMVATGDPVGFGFVASLSRPGGNITGLSNMNTDVTTKCVELLRNAIPKLSHVTVLLNPRHDPPPPYLKRLQGAQEFRGLTFSPVHAGTESQLDTAFAAMKKERSGAVLVAPDPFFAAHLRRIADLAVKYRLPSIAERREYAEAGGLIGYGQHNSEHYYRAAAYVDKIFKGAKPGELPVEQPTKFELLINGRTAKALGLTLPQELLMRADKVIE